MYNEEEGGRKGGGRGKGTSVACERKRKEDRRGRKKGKRNFEKTNRTADSSGCTQITRLHVATSGSVMCELLFH